MGSRGSEGVQQKGGDGGPLSLTGEAAYRFLPPFFFPPLAVFFAIALIPPFARRFLRGLSPRHGAAASWHVSPRCRRPSLRCVTLARGERSTSRKLPVE